MFRLVHSRPRLQRSLYGAPSGACANISTGVNSTGCYWDKSTKEFVANVRANSSCVTDNSCGGDDDQADALAHQLLTTVLGSTPLSEESLQNVLSDASMFLAIRCRVTALTF